MHDEAQNVSSVTIGTATSGYLTASPISRVKRVVETIEYGDDGSVIKKVTETEYVEDPGYSTPVTPLTPYAPSRPYYIGDPVPGQQPQIWSTNVLPCSVSFPDGNGFPTHD